MRGFWNGGISNGGIWVEGIWVEGVVLFVFLWCEKRKFYIQFVINTKTRSTRLRVYYIYIFYQLING